MFVIENINKSYGKNNILSDISFNAQSGNCIGIIGINGSGKSTLLNILAGCIPPDSGRYYFDTEGTISYLPQENPLIDDLTALDNIRLWYNGSKKDIRNEKNQIIFSKLGIHTFINKKVKTLSGGMKKRLSLAIAFMREPDLILLDEPLAALDMLCKQGIIKCLNDYLAQGGTIIAATHETSILNLCDKIYLLKNGMLHMKYDASENDEKFTEADFCKML